MQFDFSFELIMVSKADVQPINLQWNTTQHYLSLNIMNDPINTQNQIRPQYGYWTTEQVCHRIETKFN